MTEKARSIRADRLRRWLWRAIGPIVLVVILLSLEPSELVASFRRADPFLLFAAYLVALPAVLFRAVRWKLLLGKQSGRLTYGQTLGAYAYSILVGLATPGRLGEFVKVLHATRHGVAAGVAVSSVLLDRLYDVGLLLIVALGAAVFLAMPGADREVVLLAVLVPVAAALLLAWVALRTRSLSTSLSALGRVLPRALRDRLPSLKSELAEALRGLTFPRLSISLLLTVVAWAITYAANYLFALSLGLGIGYLEIVGISAICSLVAMLPISIMGAGTRDAALLVILSRYGASWEQTVAFSALLLSITVWVGLVCALSLLTSAQRVVGDSSPLER